MNGNKKPAFDNKLLLESAVEAIKKLDPRVQARNPVMFVTLVGAVLSSAAMVQALNCSNDDFIHTTEARHYRASEEIWRRMAGSPPIIATCCAI